MTGAALKAPAAYQPQQAPSSAPRLRLLPKGASGLSTPDEPARARVADARATGLTPARDRPPVLIAGRDAARRAQVRRDLDQVMPQGTRFEELGSLWEVLVRAPASRIVIVSGEVDEVPAESLLHTLAQRHPDLPVISLETP